MNKYQLIIRNVKTLEEKQICIFRPKWLYSLAIVMIVSIMGLSFWMFNTIFSKWVNPLDYYNISSEKFTQMVESINELELSAKQNEHFVTLLQNVISGKEVDLNDIVYNKKNQRSDTKNHSLAERRLIQLEPNDNDSLQDSNIVSSVDKSDYNSSSSHKTKPYLQSFNSFSNNKKDEGSIGLIFLPPASGNIISHYKEKTSLYKSGITIESPTNTPICCIADGVIIFSGYILGQNSYVTIIQHNQSIISVYRHFSKCLIPSGIKVHAGDVISIVSSPLKPVGYNFVFELWIDSHQVNPEDHIIF